MAGSSERQNARLIAIALVAAVLVAGLGLWVGRSRSPVSGDSGLTALRTSLRSELAALQSELKVQRAELQVLRSELERARDHEPALPAARSAAAAPSEPRGLRDLEAKLAVLERRLSEPRSAPAGTAEDAGLAGRVHALEARSETLERNQLSAHEAAQERLFNLEARLEKLEAERLAGQRQLLERLERLERRTETAERLLEQLRDGS